MRRGNLNRIKSIALGLGEINEQAVFVGGAVAEIYADDPASTEIRMTMDVDCVLQLASIGNYYAMEKTLRDKGFENDTSPGAPICRKVYRGELVDVMSDDDSALGFTNIWYKPGIEHRVQIKIDDDVSIYVFPPLYYIATKIEAIKGRAGTDWRDSHDLEDLVYVLNNCEKILKAFYAESNTRLVEYLSSWAAQLLARRNMREELECALPLGDESRIDYIIDVLEHMAAHSCAHG